MNVNHENRVGSPWHTKFPKISVLPPHAILHFSECGERPGRGVGIVRRSLTGPWKTASEAAVLRGLLTEWTAAHH